MLGFIWRRITKFDNRDYKVRQLSGLKSATIMGYKSLWLLDYRVLDYKVWQGGWQSVTGITKCDGITKSDSTTNQRSSSAHLFINCIHNLIQLFFENPTVGSWSIVLRWCIICMTRLNSKHYTIHEVFH